MPFYVHWNKQFITYLFTDCHIEYHKLYCYFFYCAFASFIMPSHGRKWYYWPSILKGCVICKFSTVLRSRNLVWAWDNGNIFYCVSCSKSENIVHVGSSGSNSAWCDKMTLKTHFLCHWDLPIGVEKSCGLDLFLSFACFGNYEMVFMS